MSTVFRVEKTANFTVMSNTHLKDRRLSYKAKGLLSVILSLPPDWDYTITGLAVIAADGVDSVKTALRELEQYGYIARAQLRDERGRMAQNEYRVYENPSDNPDYVPSERTSYERTSSEQDAPDENAKQSCASLMSKYDFSVSPSVENPSAAAPTADNSQADTIIKSNKNILSTEELIHSFSPAQAQDNEDRKELKNKDSTSYSSFSSYSTNTFVAPFVTPLVTPFVNSSSFAAPIADSVAAQVADSFVDSFAASFADSFAAPIAEREHYSEMIRENICYEDKYANNISDSRQVDELVSIMTDVVCSSSPTVRVNGEAVSQGVVKSRFLKLTDEEIDYVLYALRHKSSRVGNMRSYLITALYNAGSTIGNYYANMAYNDIREGVL